MSNVWSKNHVEVAVPVFGTHPSGGTTATLPPLSSFAAAWYAAWYARLNKVAVPGVVHTSKNLHTLAGSCVWCSAEKTSVDFHATCQGGGSVGAARA